MREGGVGREGEKKEEREGRGSRSTGRRMAKAHLHSWTSVFFKITPFYPLDLKCLHHHKLIENQEPQLCITISSKENETARKREETLKLT